MIVTRLVYSVGTTFLYPAANVIDGSTATRADLYLTGSFQADYFLVDQGASLAVGSVHLQNTTATNNPLAVWVTDNPSLDGSDGVQGGAQLTGPATNPQAAGTDYVFTAPGGSATGRYLFVRQTYGPSSSALIGEVTPLAPGQALPTPPPPVPSLSGSGFLNGNTPAILLQGH